MAGYEKSLPKMSIYPPQFRIFVWKTEIFKLNKSGWHINFKIGGGEGIKHGGIFCCCVKKVAYKKPMEGREVMLLLTFIQNLVNVIRLDIRSIKKLHFDLRRGCLAHGPKQMFFIQICELWLFRLNKKLLSLNSERSV